MIPTDSRASVTPSLDDQMTPKARPPGMDINPFDLLHDRPSSGRGSAMGLLNSERAGDRASEPSVLLTPGYAQGHMASFDSAAAASMTNKPTDFMIRMPTPKPKASDDKDATRNTGSAKGYLNVLLMEARNLAVSSTSLSKPYVVIQYDKNEYIGESGNCSDGSNPSWDETVTFDVTMDNQNVQFNNTTPNGVDIKKKERKSENEPLSKSIQEKFRGFSYSGTYESSVDALERGVNAIDWGKDVEEDAVV
ncbi:sch9-serine threonine protein kinase [Malassezia pachydermatis]|uniref:Sch9-serine threonine protein kinase n=1 Tax=Malassezia pachydermatis TaxID=77020 RepID=A0A0M8MNU7_9BASI|nr:sch9-serine threonine protein kinase [Malassezia pachydermatis]KOS13857.1 sch9-serine threonine protein kinase [Malassezia pachydermatis]